MLIGDDNDLCKYPNLHNYRPRKFSFDPKLKKLFSWSEIDSNEGCLSKFYHNGKLVSNKETGSELSEAVSSEQPTLISFLKSELMSDCEDEEESMVEQLDQTRENIKTDEEMAYTPQYDPKMGPIFKIFQMDY